jgi:hypothetical protein
MLDRALTEQEALNVLRQAGVIEAESIAALGRMWGWKRERTSKAVPRWERAGRIMREPGPGGKIVIRVRAGTGNGTAGNGTANTGNGTAGNGTGPRHKRKARTNGSGNGSGNGRSRYRSYAPGPDDVSAGPAPEAAASTGSGSGNGAAVPDPAPASAVPASDRVPAPATVPAVPVPAERDRITLLTALASAIVSAGFSIYGLTAIFGGALWPVIALGVVLECDKLRAVALIRMGRGSWWVRAGLVVTVAVLMGLNAVGAYGFLAKAHIAATEETRKAIAASLADIDGKIAVQNNNIENINRQLSEIHGGIAKATAQGKVNGAMALINQQRNNLAQLQTDLQAAGTVLTGLKVEKAKIEPSPGKKDESEAKEVDADLGPVRYLAALIGVNDQDVLHWFILVVAVLLDPLAVLLLFAATRTTVHD